MSNRQLIHHFILTRFNLRLWSKDKEGVSVRTKEWLEHRFSLFERYCMPSIKNQTCKDFQWIVLLDSKTPEQFKERITEYQKECSQLVPMYVEPEDGRRFAELFRQKVIQQLCCTKASVDQASNNEYKDRVLTTYLDNDDALNVRFVEDCQQRASSLSDATFVFYTEGYQFFIDHHYLMKILYPRNHFVSVIEDYNPATVKTIYGYGSHYYIDRIKSAKILYVKNLPMWCQVVHNKNMGNDAYFLGARMVKDESVLVTDFGLNEKVHCGIGLYLLGFLPRYFKTLIRR